MDLMEFHKYLREQKNFILFFAESFRGNEEVVAEIKRIASNLDAINACVFPLAPFKPKPFVFTDWLAEVGFVYIEQYKGWQNDKTCLILHADNKFMIDIFHKCVFREINIPTTREQAEFLFNSFNLLT